MSIKRFNPNPEFTKNAWISSEEQYSNIYNESIQGPDTFWAKIAERLHWNKKWSSVCEFDFANANIKWFEGGKLNVSVNCLDRHVEAGDGEKTAIIWEGNDPNESKHFTFNELLEKVQRFSNVLKNLGVERKIGSTRGSY